MVAQRSSLRRYRYRKQGREEPELHRELAPSRHFVKMNGTIQLYQDKAPYEQSGFSIRGAVEYDPDRDELRCHECGGWYQHLGKHVVSGHGFKISAYKCRHGLQLKSALVSEKIRRTAIRTAVDAGRAYSPEFWLAGWRAMRHASSGRRGFSFAERRNARGHCREQILRKIRELAQSLGRAPSERELNTAGLLNAVYFHFGTSGECARAVGLRPNPSGGSSTFQPQRYSNAYLLERLRSFTALHGRLPAASDARRGKLPSATLYYLRFGTWRRALRSAHLSEKPEYNFSGQRGSVGLSEKEARSGQARAFAR